MKYIYVANWKMNLSFNDSINFCTKNHAALQQQLSHNATEIIICPSFVALAPIADLFKNSAIAIGAQNCSEYESGAYTGEIAAQSLAQIGIKYCIIGHSERRMYYGETTEQIIKKINLLYNNNITPIICIGETQENFLNKQTFTVLTEQLNPILTAITQQYRTKNPLMIAYEPLFSIGTGIIPDHEHLTSIFTWLTEFIQSHLPNHPVQLLYGGSVNHSTIEILKKIPPINGFLIGGASTDFDQLKKIITL